MPDGGGDVVLYTTPGGRRVRGSPFGGCSLWFVVCGKRQAASSGQREKRNVCVTAYAALLPILLPSPVLRPEPRHSFHPHRRDTCPVGSMGHEIHPWLSSTTLMILRTADGFNPTCALLLSYTVPTHSSNWLIRTRIWGIPYPPQIQ